MNWLHSCILKLAILWILSDLAQSRSIGATVKFPNYRDGSNADPESEGDCETMIPGKYLIDYLVSKIPALDKAFRDIFAQGGEEIQRAGEETAAVLNGFQDRLKWLEDFYNDINNRLNPPCD